MRASYALLDPFCDTTIVALYSTSGGSTGVRASRGLFDVSDIGAVSHLLKQDLLKEKNFSVKTQKKRMKTCSTMTELEGVFIGSRSR